MNVTAIISEFNPFHNGHQYLIKKLRSQGSEYIISIMSGNFTQRGTPAVISKHARAHAALACGADLVVEIPVIWCVSPAERYASAGVYLADALGCTDTLGFACGCGNISGLKAACSIVSDDNFKLHLKEHIKSGVTLAKAYSLAVSEYGDSSIKDIFASPDNILAAEYIKALNKIKSDINPYAVKRIGSGHDSCSPEGDYASASYIRELMLKGSKFSRYVPEESYEIIKREVSLSRAPADINNAGRAVPAVLRKMDRESLSMISDVSEGLEGRICKAVRYASDINELMQGIKTKRYTMSRIRRLILCSFLGITQEMADSDIPYIRVLGAGRRGFEILKRINKYGSLPVITRFSDIKKLDSHAASVFKTECISSDLYNLMLPKPGPCGTEQEYTPVII